MRPQVTDAIEMDVRGGQHPVVAAAECERVVSARNAHEDGSDGSGGGSSNGSGGSGSGGFVFSPNDCVMEHARSRFWLMTGPNMAGKSTFLRQTALLCIMAQAGSFVPAVSARIGVVDQILTRAGSSDNLVADQSTFMVEMLETAHILRSATARSLVLMDEVGRG